MEKLNANNLDNDLRRLDSDSESVLSESEILFGFLYPHGTSAGYPTGATD